MANIYTGSSQEGNSSSISCWLNDTSFSEETQDHIEQVIKIIQSAFKLVTLKCIKIELKKKSIISLAMFYKNRNKLVYRVTRVVIYTTID